MNSKAFYKSCGISKIFDKGKLGGEIFFFEKYDGSQLSFVIQDKEVFILNKGNLHPSSNKLYRDAYIYFINIFLPQIIELYGDKYIFHGESMIMKYRSSSLTYASIPQGSFVCFAIQEKNSKKWVYPIIAMQMAKKIGMTFAHLLWSSIDPYNYHNINFEKNNQNQEYPKDTHALAKMITSNKEGRLISSLGNSAEGLVAQCYENYKIRFKKYSTQYFQEINIQKKNKIGEQLDDITLIRYIGLSFCMPARYQKGYQQYLVQTDCSENIDIILLSTIIWKDICSEKIDFIKNVLYDNINRIYFITLLKKWYDNYDKFGCTIPNIISSSRIAKLVNGITMEKTDKMSMGDFFVLFNDKYASEIKESLFLEFESDIKNYALSDLVEWLKR